MIERVIVLLALALAGIYSFVLIAMFLGLFKVKRYARRQERESVFVSVIVAARNE